MLVGGESHVPRTVGSEILKPKGKSMFAHFRPTKYQRKANRPKSPVFPLHLELLEDRTLPSSYSVTELPSLVAGTPHAAADPMYTAMTGAGPNLKSEPQQDFVEVRAVVQLPPRGARQAIDNGKDELPNSAGCFRGG